MPLTPKTTTTTKRSPRPPPPVPSLKSPLLQLPPLSFTATGQRPIPTADDRSSTPLMSRTPSETRRFNLLSTTEVVIILMDCIGFVSIFKMKRDVPFPQLRKAFDEDHYESLRLIFEGRRPFDNQTPKMTEMKAGKAYEMFSMEFIPGGVPTWKYRRMLKGGPPPS
ncbi:hypothetical protein I302_106941 [Kwoniella bestiolae CBS 10118]|uniref:Uncharacterized protein n=1 Tax=Kwoniella bestiolae CBS 10118 TaxID=1296100 RepID=A0A1B9FZY1_9TREE|nr:hypothetical protein I302_05793 [Kwoniella bestiolae CBS 10118]OCF24334.1 hypothetical protein I302_05793 [Kwoniella bestiolae CBS 10118]